MFIENLLSLSKPRARNRCCCCGTNEKFFIPPFHKYIKWTNSTASCNCYTQFHAFGKLHMCDCFASGLVYDLLLLLRLLFVLPHHFKQRQFINVYLCYDVRAFAYVSCKTVENLKLNWCQRTELTGAYALTNDGMGAIMFKCIHSLK